MCRVMNVSTSGFYAWRNRKPSKRDREDQELTEQIKEIHSWSRGTYGAPRIYDELRDRGVRIGRGRIARLMRAAGLRGVSRRKGPRTTVSDRRAHGIPDLVERDFAASRPDELWVADITYVPVRGTFLYLSVVLDVFSRRIVGWAMASNLETKLVLSALDMAVDQRRPDDVIHHSDQGSQYTSIAFGSRCRAAGVRPSMGSVGDCYDNAMCESFFATLECELIDRHSFQNHDEARMALFDYIEGWYNPHRRHSGINGLSPINYEKKYYQQLEPASV